MAYRHYTYALATHGQKKLLVLVIVALNRKPFQFAPAGPPLASEFNQPP